MIGEHDAANFHSKYVKAENGCWEWTASCFKNGYGQLKVKRLPVYAHRFSYQLHKGEIVGGLIVRHTCDNRKCVNPDHLLLGTMMDNMRDMVQRDQGKGPLTLRTVNEIFDLAHGSPYTQAAIGSLYGVSNVTVSQIKRGRHYRD